MRKIILASQSPNRKAALEKVGLPFSVEVSGYEEDMSLDMSPEKLAITMALGKARMVADKHKNAIVIGADTFAIFGGRLLGKPRDAAEARTMLKKLRGKWHYCVSGLAVIDSKSGKRYTRAVKTRVHMRKVSDAEIERYIKSGEPLRMAAGYAMQSGAASWIDRIDGDHWNIIGLPLASLVVALRKFGVELK